LSTGSPAQYGELRTIAHLAGVDLDHVVIADHHDVAEAVLLQRDDAVVRCDKIVSAFQVPGTLGIERLADLEVAR
jgi:hypothetical protein